MRTTRAVRRLQAWWERISIVRSVWRGQARPSAGQSSREPGEQPAREPEGQSAREPERQSAREPEGQSAREPGEQSAQEPEGQSPQGAQAEFPSQQIKSDKADNIGDPDRNNSVVARDENTGHNKTAVGVAPSAVARERWCC